MKKPLELHPEPLLKERQWTEDGLPVLSMTLSLPSCRALLPDARLRRINRCYAHFARCYESYCENFLLPIAAQAFRAAAAAGRPFCPRQAVLRYRTALQTPLLWSVLLEAEESGEACVFRRLRSDTWSLADGYLLRLADFFPEDPHPLRRIRRLAMQEFSARQQDGAFPADWRRRLRTAAKQDNFYLTEEGLCFYYPQFTLGAGACGIPTLCLPWSEGGPVPPEGISPTALDKSVPAVLS